MRNIFIYLVLTGIFACGDPSEQQANRQKLIEGLDDHKIKRVTNEELHAAAYQEGSRIVGLLTETSFNFEYWNTAGGLDFLDSLNTVLNHGGIQLITGDTPTNELNADQIALMEAYEYSAEQGVAAQENVQGNSGPYLLYTYPLSNDDRYFGLWSILISKKALIRNL